MQLPKYLKQSSYEASSRPYSAFLVVLSRSVPPPWLVDAFILLVPFGWVPVLNNHSGSVELPILKLFLSQPIMASD